MQISSGGVQVGSTNYTWQQSLRFFILGITYATVYALLPVGVVLWHNYVNYSDPVDWSLVWQMTLAAVGPAAYSYYREHKALLKAPPWFDIPPEFKPQLKQVTNMTQVVTPTGDGGKVIETAKETHTEPMVPKTPDPGPQ
jgi:hypothetical protein